MVTDTINGTSNQRKPTPQTASRIATSESEHEISETGAFVRQLNRFTVPAVVDLKTGKVVNNGVYKAGFVRTLEAYGTAYALVFRRLDWLDGRLSQSRYLFGDTLTDSDIRLWVTLARFDAAYYNAFRLNRNRLIDFPSLWAYARDLYQIPAFGENTWFDHIKAHYHVCCDPGNPFGIIPKGPDTSCWDTPHRRERLSGGMSGRR